LLLTPLQYANYHDLPYEFVLYAIREGRLSFHLVRRGNHIFYLVSANAVIAPDENNLLEQREKAARESGSI
jgi:hypothetical protein